MITGPGNPTLETVSPPRPGRQRAGEFRRSRRPTTREKQPAAGRQRISRRSPVHIRASPCKPRGAGGTAGVPPDHRAAPGPV